MHDSNLPVGPAANEARPPSRAEAARAPALVVERRPGPLSLDLLSDDNREESAGADLMGYWNILVKRRWLALGVLAAVLVFSLLKTLDETPIYRATAMLQIDNYEQQVVQQGNVDADAYYGSDDQFFETQIQLLRGYELAERVADQLNLDEQTLAGQYPPGWLARVKNLVRPAPAAAPPKPGGAKTSLEAATGVVRSGLIIEPVPNSRLVRVHFDSAAPGFAAMMANAVAEGAVAKGLDRRLGATTYAKSYLEDQIKQLKSRLEESELALVEFARKEGIVYAGGGQSLAVQNLSELSGQLSNLQAQRIGAEARWSQAQAATGAALPANLLKDPVLQKLTDQRSLLRGQYQQKLQILLPNYPEMLQLKAQLDDLNKQIADQLGEIRSSLKAEYDAALNQENLLNKQLSALREQALDVDSRSIRYTILKREVDTNRQLYDNLLQRYKEVGVASDVQINNIAVVEHARVPGGPYRPDLSANMMRGLMVGLLLGILAALGAEFLDDTLKTPEDIEKRLKLPVLGIIPKLVKQTVAQAVDDPRSGFSEAYRSARTALQFSTGKGVPKVLLITSAGPGEGKSVTALTLARNFSRLGKRVLLIEGDLRNPSLGRSLAIRADKGMSNLLAGAASINEVVLKTDDKKLDVILSGPLPPSPTELLSGTKLVSLLTVASEHYDQIVIDGPPVMGLADALLLANASDGTLLMVHSGKTRVHTATSAVKRLATAHAHLVGSLLSYYDAKLSGYRYTYEGYYNSYGDAPQLGKR